MSHVLIIHEVAAYPAWKTIADLFVGSHIFQLGFADIVPKEQNIKNWYQRVCEVEGFRKSLPQA